LRRDVQDLRRANEILTGKRDNRTLLHGDCRVDPA
jgi:hypothetical protein